MRPNKNFLRKATDKEAKRMAKLMNDPVTKLQPGEPFTAAKANQIYDLPGAKQMNMEFSGVMKKGGVPNALGSCNPVSATARRETEKTILAQRARFYSPSDAALRAAAAATGSAIRAVLMGHWQMSLPEIPPHIVHLIMTQIKIVRASLPHASNPDNWLDAHNYLDLAETLKEQLVTMSFTIDPKHVKIEPETFCDFMGHKAAVSSFTLQDDDNVTNTDDGVKQGVRKKRKGASPKGRTQSPRSGKRRT